MVIWRISAVPAAPIASNVLRLSPHHLISSILSLSLSLELRGFCSSRCWGEMAIAAAAVVVPLGLLFFISGLFVNLFQVCLALMNCSTLGTCFGFYPLGLSGKIDLLPVKLLRADSLVFLFWVPFLCNVPLRVSFFAGWTAVPERCRGQQGEPRACDVEYPLFIEVEENFEFDACTDVPAIGQTSLFGENEAVLHDWSSLLTTMPSFSLFSVLCSIADNNEGAQDGLWPKVKCFLSGL